MRKILAFLLYFPVMAFAQDAAPKEWKQLFNGKDLKDWHIKIRNYALDDNFGKTFRVEDGLMKVRYDGYSSFDEKFGHIFYKDKFSYYKIAVEYRFVGEQAKDGPGWATRNSGIMLHCQSPESMGKDQDFPISIEVQLLGGLGNGKRTTCNVCTPGTNLVFQNKLDKRHCINSDSKTYDGDQWVRAEVLVLGDSLIRHYVNGEKVLEYTKPQTGGGNVLGHDPALLVEGKLLGEGYISLQSESHPVDFRKVELLNLCGCTDPKASNYKSYYVKSDNKSCVYKRKKK
ncbi:3-keto-disaccharide hydrolase [Emticicia sp. 17c]|uniref:3-keto-disaccharide hydrolase n=1 Tax=Emticicia sp. 17c TaxID=3127704 RepID=UPI00301DB122